MSSTYSQLHIHLVFAVSNRANVIQENWKTKLYNYMVGIITRQGHRSIIINGVSDHIHLLIELNPDKTISELVKAIKSFSTKWINENNLTPGRFSWQKGYGAFSHSHSAVHKVINYIANQENHHLKTSFRNEYVKMLTLYEIDFKEEYIFTEI